MVEAELRRRSLGSTRDDPRRAPVRRPRARPGPPVPRPRRRDGDASGPPGGGRGRAGLTVTSFLVAAGEPARRAGPARPRLRPDRDAPRDRHAAWCSCSAWEHRDLAEMFAGTAPAPGGMFSHAAFEQTDWGPRLASAASWAGVGVEGEQPVGWSTAGHHAVVEHRRGRRRRTTPGLLGHRRGRARSRRRRGPAAMSDGVDQQAVRVMVVDDHPMWRDAVERDLVEAGLRRGRRRGRRPPGDRPLPGRSAAGRGARPADPRARTASR